MDKLISLDSRSRWIVIVIAILGVGGIYYRDSLYELILAVIHREESSHGVFVPFVSLYVFWLKLDKIRYIKPRSDLLTGVSFLAAAGFLKVIANNTGFTLSLSLLSFLIVSAALILLFFGREIMREVVFPLFFLVTMIPLPQEIFNLIADWMRLVNTWGSIKLSKFFGVPLYQEGFNIYLPDSHLYIAKSCSGIRYLLSYFTFGLAYAALLCSNAWKRVLVVIGTVPLAIVAGVTRLAVIITSAHYISPVLAENRPHIVLSWIVFAVYLFGLIAIDQYFIKKRKEHKQTA